MISRDQWLQSVSSCPPGQLVSAQEEAGTTTHLDLTKLRELLAWWLSLAISDGASLFLVRSESPRSPPMADPGAHYNPHKDPSLQGFLAKAYDAAEYWFGPGTSPDVRACLRALLDPNSCQAAWPSPEEIQKTETGFLELIEKDIEKGASPLRLVRTVMEKYALTPIQAREAINPVLIEILDNNAHPKERRKALLEIAYSGDIRNGVETQDRRLASAARTNQARVDGLITNRNDSMDKDDITKSLVEVMARLGKANPTPLPPASPPTQ